MHFEANHLAASWQKPEKLGQNNGHCTYQARVHHFKAGECLPLTIHTLTVYPPSQTHNPTLDLHQTGCPIKVKYLDKHKVLQ